MTEQEWLTGMYPIGMLRGIKRVTQKPAPFRPPSTRKLRLFAAACMWDVEEVSKRDSPDTHSTRFATQAEEWADTGCIPDDFRALWDPADIYDDPFQHAKNYATLAWRHRGDRTVQQISKDQANLLRDIVGNPFRPVVVRDNRLYIGQGDLAWPWDVTKIAWITPDVLSLAKAAYGHLEVEKECKECLGRGGRWEVNSDQWYNCPACDGERSIFITSDTRGKGGQLDPARLAVLSDAMEENGCGDELLAALRSPGPHYRGFWALDVILGKE